MQIVIVFFMFENTFNHFMFCFIPKLAYKLFAFNIFFVLLGYETFHLWGSAFDELWNKSNSLTNVEEVGFIFIFWVTLKRLNNIIIKKLTGDEFIVGIDNIFIDSFNLTHDVGVSFLLLHKLFRFFIIVMAIFELRYISKSFKIKWNLLGFEDSHLTFSVIDLCAFPFDQFQWITNTGNFVTYFHVLLIKEKLFIVT